MPKRIQRQHTKGWRMPDNTIYVGRGSRWGNPYKVVKRTTTTGPLWDVVLTDGQRQVPAGTYLTKDLATRTAVRLHAELIAEYPTLVDQIRIQFEGRDVVCWCATDSPWCHGDTYLRIAAGGAP